MLTVTAAGIDTWSPCWNVEPESPAGDWLTAAATASAARGKLLPEAVMGHRVGWIRSAGLLYAEGHPGGDHLGAPDALPRVHAALVQSLVEAGVPVPIGRAGSDVYGERYEGTAGVRRVDTTVDLAAPSAAEGFAVLAGIAAVARDMPRTKAHVWWDTTGRVQTVALHGYGGGKMLGRVYDKGAESGVAAPGRLLRPEDQRRWAKGSRRGVDELTSEYVRSKFHQRFAPLWQASKGVTVAGPIVIAEKLAEAIDAGELTREHARNLAGDLVLDLVGKRPSRWTRQRHQRTMRDLGLVLSDGVLQEVEVDLGAALEAALEADAWERRG